MNRTRFLVALLVVVALIQVYPDRAATIEMLAIGGAALYCIIWATARALARYKKTRLQAAREAADDREYRLYHQELESIRAKYDPHRDVTDPASISQEYKDELTRLHDRHQGMLDRKFGPR
ncbi:MAG: hypothetical protein JWN43_1906 [Gammaproteobacteria bacterium]|nr:hypothetical protein [Gammaproteobacteria bacterium]